MNAATQLGFGDLDHELANTRRILERVPMERGDWKAHEKSFSVGATATHIATLVYWMQEMILQDDYDLANASHREAVKTTDALLQEFDAHVAKLNQLLAQATPESMMAPWTLRMGSHVIFTMPRAAVIRGMGINHMIHHRGQLSVFLRLLDVPVPGMYGPSADEK